MDEEQWFNDRRYSEITEKHPDPKIYPDFYKARRMEFILRPGEMIFIPYGWFHFVFSEDPDPVSGLCAAINFWYYTDNKMCIEKNKNRPKFGWHDISFDEVLETIKTEQFYISTNVINVFPPTHMKFRYPELSFDYMTYDEFYEAKNNLHYIAQNTKKQLNDFAIPYENPVDSSSIWINWGNCNTLPHYDGRDNWLCQLKGTRRVILTPPEDRDLMYLFNKYPIDLVHKINYKLRHDEKLIHVENVSIHQNVVHELLDALGNKNEVFVECTDLSSSFVRELHMHNSLLKINDSMELPNTLKFSTFEIKRYFQGDDIQIECPLGALWFLTEGKIKVRKSILQMKSGCVISFPGNWLYPVKVEIDCIIIKPYGGFNNGT